MDKQGNMGKLESKTKAELIELLIRQQKLLANRKQLDLLKDKGQKVKLLAEKLQQLIAEREKVMDDTADLFEQMDIGAPKDVPHATKNAFLKTDHGPTIGDKKLPFKPHRTLRTDKIPEEFVRPAAPPSRGNTPRHGAEERPPEVSAVSYPPLRHPGTQALNVEEAGELLQKQKSKVEALLAEQAAERLTERLDIKMGEYKPLMPGRYRDQADDSDDDSEEDSEEEGDDGDQESQQKGKKNIPNR